MKEKYLTRSIDSILVEWKTSLRRKPLLVRGARQVGKSMAVKHLGESFDYFLDVNCERNPEVIEFFKGTRDVKTIVNKLSDFFDIPVIPGKTLLFLDEIQKSEDVIHSLWSSRKTTLSCMSLLQVRYWNLP